MPDRSDMPPAPTVLPMYAIGRVLDALNVDDTEQAERRLDWIEPAALRRLGELLDRASQLCFNTARKRGGRELSLDELRAALRAETRRVALEVGLPPTRPVHLAEEIAFDLEDEL